MFIGMFVPAKASCLAKKLEKKENGKKDLSVINRVVSPVGILRSTGFLTRLGPGSAYVCQNVSDRFRACIENFFIKFTVTILIILDLHLSCSALNAKIVDLQLYPYTTFFDSPS